MHAKRFRLQHKFWLDMEKPEERELAEVIEELKQARDFSRVVRVGIRLVVDLWRGNLDVLLDVFPWVEEAFYQRFTEQQPASDSALHQQLARLENLLIEQGSVPLESHGVGPKKLTVTIPTAPAADDIDDELLIIRQAKPERDSAQNFLSSAFNLVQ